METPTELWAEMQYGGEDDGFSVRVEIEDGVPQLCLWYGSEYHRLGIPIPELPRFIAFLQSVHEHWTTHVP